MDIRENEYFCAVKVGITICICGTAEKILNGRRYTMQRGTLHIISPLIPCVELSQSEDYAALSLIDTPEQLLDVMYPYLSHLAERNMPLFPVIELPEERCCYYESNIRDILSQQAEVSVMPHGILRQAKEKLILLRKQTLVLELLTHVLSQPTASIPKPFTHKEQIVMQFIQSIVKNHTTERQVAFYADQAGLSQRYFSSIVSERLGMTPIEIITLVTINNAKRLLHKKGVQVKSVAEQLGFPEQFTFRKYFKTHTGMSPKEFRNIGTRCEIWNSDQK